MKVYVIDHRRPYEGSDIAGIYSTREKAEKALFEKTAIPSEYAKIVEYELDSGLELYED